MDESSLSSDPLGMKMGAVLDLSKQKTKRLTMFSCAVVLILATSLRNSSHLHLDSLKIFTVTRDPSGTVTSGEKGSNTCLQNQILEMLIEMLEELRKWPQKLDGEDGKLEEVSDET
ncbi:hypothetical protein PanWU01x14_204810 [Parasponia andersonii]|uniref:Uncharacterized protein n=1 Tax=Parasponia andersonii TaxID=3476 RepID=A0A2P5BWG4_PARAD|nr:hypothetical protein PanWU01x14_204810 [Parasponia andersonii]